MRCDLRINTDTGPRKGAGHKVNEIENHALPRFSLAPKLGRDLRKKRGHLQRSFRLESLESRQLLAAGDIIINEFLARNDGGLRDGNGRTSDWIEIFNTGQDDIDLAGYRLTNDPADASKWVFPNRMLGAGQYEVVFASGQQNGSFVDTAGNLHTNFTLRRGGDYLALMTPDGSVATEFGSKDTLYPEQLPNVSYGGAQSLTLFDSSSPASFAIPLDGSLDQTWNDPNLDAAANGFTVGTASLGYEREPDSRTNLAGLFDTEIPGTPHAVYVRMEFDLKDASAITDLLLTLNYDDGIIVYLNGVQVAEDNAPARAGWFATATNNRRDRDVFEPVEFDLSEHSGALIDGTNVLGVHLMNHISDNSAMLLTAQLDAGASDLTAATGVAAKFGYMTNPTPGGPNASNSQIFDGFVADTRFSVNRGFFTEPFQVEITTETADAVIRYTSDGSTPRANHGEVYSGPITISTTTPLRAAAFKDGFLSTNVDTQTYLFLKDVINQGTMPPGYPSEWGLGIGPVLPADYAMDPDITQHPAYRDVMIDALTQIPTVSIVTDIHHLFDAETGIYQSAEASGIQWERPASVELINPDGTDGFQEDAGLRIQGGASRITTRSPKHSFRLLFKGEYGSTKLRYPLFSEETAVQEFDTIILRAGFNQSWIHHNTFLGDNRGRAQYVRDQWAKNTQRAMGWHAPHTTYAHLYINGMYWGLYNPTERPTDGFTASYFGGEKEEYDIYNSGENLDGTPDAWNRLFELAEMDLSDDANYEAVANILDIDAYIDYMLMNHYGANADWDDHNWYASRRRTEDGKWQFYMWDSEFLFIGQNDNGLGVSDGRRFPAIFLAHLSANEEFRIRYADRIHKHFFNDGLLTPDSVIDRWEELSSQITDAIVAESARWGDYRLDIDQSGTPLVLLERDVHWVKERNRLLNEYFPARTQIVLDQYREPFRMSRTDIPALYPSVDAPQLNQHGGVISRDFRIQLSGGEGTIYFTTDGTDPRIRGGAVSPSAAIYSDPLQITSDTTIMARALHNDQWSALTEASFAIASDFALKITEINYNPHDANSAPGGNESDVDNDRFEFLELMNVGAQSVNLQGVQLVQSAVGSEQQGISFTFAAQDLAAGGRTVVVRDREAFASRYGTSVPIAAGSGNEGEDVNTGTYGGRLSNNGEQLTLLDATGQVVQQFAYKTRCDWPARAKGQGSSLQIVNPRGSVTDPSNWIASFEFGGSPGSAGSTASGGIVINEVLANTSSTDSDLLELYNSTSQDVDVSNWYVTDDAGNYFKSRIATAQTVPARGYLVLSESDFGLDLDGIGGSDVLLISADASGKPLQFIERISFGLADQGVSLGPWPTSTDPFVPLNETTFGGPNAGHKVPEVIISEIYFNPLDPDGGGVIRARDLQFAEVTNASDTAIDLTGWQLAGDVEYVFPEGTQLEGNSSMVLVTFDPTSRTGVNTANVFKVALGMSFSDTIFGRIVDVENTRSRDPLRDEGALVQLVRPGTPAADDPSSIPMIVVDQVSYLPESPWPEGIAGEGKSITRTRPEDYGLFPISWVGADPMPGRAEFFTRLAGDANDDGQFDQLDITLVLQAAKYNTGQPASWSQGDWNGDGAANQLDLVTALQTGRYLQGPLAALDEVFEDF